MISPSRILYEDDHLLVVEKLPRELSVAGKGKVEKKSLYDYLKPDYPGLTVVHRLDYETSGVIVFAKSSKVAERIVSDHLLKQKTYLALVNGVMRKSSGEISKKLQSRSDGERIDATSKYKVLERLEGLTLVEVTLASGRRHQVRQHLAMIRHPLILDAVYGDDHYNQMFQKAFRLSHFFLHAVIIELEHPETGEEIVVASPLPKQFEQIVRKCRA